MLQVIEFPIGLARYIQFFVGGGDAAPVTIQPDDLVEHWEKSQTMRDEKDDAVFAVSAQVAVNSSFCRHIDGGEGGVENQ